MRVRVPPGGLRQLYQELSAEERRCEYCGGVIRRNIDIHNGRLYHHGCWLEASERRYRCLSCGAWLSWLELGEAYVQGRRVRSCPSCGGRVRALRRR
jgi:DNA-directed RNA polymerase subunit RPC12/RpoP